MSDKIARQIPGCHGEARLIRLCETIFHKGERRTRNVVGAGSHRLQAFCVKGSTVWKLFIRSRGNQQMFIFCWLEDRPAAVAASRCESALKRVFFKFAAA
jgi:hypothetical protein